MKILGSIACVIILQVLCVVIVASIIVGSIGAAFYVSDKHSESVYRSTMCFVKSYTTITDTCSDQDCDTTETGTTCTTNYYQCTIPMYTVVYHILDGREIESTIIGADGPGANSVSFIFLYIDG